MTKLGAAGKLGMRMALVGVALFVAPSCMMEEPCAENDGVCADEDLASESAALTNDNGLNNNGLNNNGLNNNGLNNNGLNNNGLNNNGLFKAWFDTTDTTLHGQRDQVMKYLVRCALPTGQSASYGGSTWQGAYGLAPGWFTGVPTTANKEMVTACLLAHVNTAGKTVHMSFNAVNGSSTALGSTAGEVNTYDIREGGFYGNLWDSAGPKRYACSDFDGWASSASSVAAVWGRDCSTTGCGIIDYRGICGSSSTNNCVNTTDFFQGCYQSNITTQKYSQIFTTYLPMIVEAESGMTGLSGQRGWPPVGRSCINSSGSLGGSCPTEVSCVNCGNKKAVNLAGTTNGVRLQHSFTTSTSDAYKFEIRYSNGSGATQYVNVRTGKLVNAAQTWTSWQSVALPSTGGWDTWGTVQLSVPSWSNFNDLTWIDVRGNGGTSGARLDFVAWEM